jgi:Fur family zinc uptake transcriptional regulator
MTASVQPPLAQTGRGLYLLGMTTACGHQHPHHGLSGHGLAARLTAADSRCAGSGQKLTPPRRRVLELLLGAGQPVKAYDLIASYGQDGAPAKPPTVYRALDFLARQGFVHRIESLNAYVACRHGASEGGDSHGAGFLICDCCGMTREMEPLRLEGVEQAADAAGFTIQSITLEAHGLCADCRS